MGCRRVWGLLRGRFRRPIRPQPPRPPKRDCLDPAPGRLLQFEWWKNSLAVFVDGHNVGSLPLTSRSMPELAHLSVYTFHAENITRMPGRAASCLLPTELASATAFSGMDLPGRAHAGPSEMLPCAASWPEILPDVIPPGTCSLGLREAVVNSNFWLDAGI